MKPYLLKFIIALTLQPFMLSCYSSKPVDKGEEYLKRSKEGIIKAISELKFLDSSQRRCIEIIVPQEFDDSCSFLKINEFIALETSEEFLVGSIDRIEILENKIYILDRQSNSVYIFAIDGKILKVIKDIGRGPTEYLQLSTMYICNENKYIMLYCSQFKKILYYDLEGNFLGIKNIFLWVKDFSMFPTGEFSYYIDRAYNNSEMLLITDDKKNYPIKKGISGNKVVNDKINVFSNCSYIKNYKDKKQIMPVFRDTLYEFTIDSLYAKYALNFGRKKLPQEYLVNSDSYDNLNNNLKKNGEELLYSLGDFFETDDFVGFSLQSSLFHYSLLFCKQSGNTFFGRLRDSDTGMPVLIPATQTINNTLIGYCYPDHILKYYSENKHKDLPADFVKICESIGKFDNPIILRFELSPF